MSSYVQLYKGTDLESYAEEIDEVLRLSEEGSISEEEKKDLIETIYNAIEIGSMCTDMQRKATILKSLELISKAI